MSKAYPSRKLIRLRHHDYSDGAYFITVCSSQHKHCFGKIADGVMHLNKLGLLLDNILNEVNAHYPYAEIPIWVVMPNHFHAIVLIDNPDSRTVSPESKFGGRQSILATVVGGIKSTLSRMAKKEGINFIWQNRFYDHIIRNPLKANEISEYIRTNPQRWRTDQYNTDHT